MIHTEGVDLVLVNPGARTAIYQSLGRRLTAVENPIWAGLIATFVRRRGHSVEVVDAEADELAPSQIAERVEAIRPRLVAIVVYGHQPSASTQNMTGASLACTAIRERVPDARILMLGGHVAALPERTLAEEACDFVAHDEGLHTIVDLLEADRQGDRSLDKIRGLAYWQSGTLRQIRSNAAAPLVRDLEHDMPGVAWDLLPMDKYRAHNWHCFGQPEREPYAAIYTTLGCPFKCSFCCIQAPFKAGEKELGLKETVNSVPVLEPGAGHRGDRPARQQVRRAQHQVRRRDVRAQRAPRVGHLRSDHRAGLRPEHLGLRAGRHGQGRHAGQAETCRLQLAGVRHRSGQRSRVERRRQALRDRAGLRHDRTGQGRRDQHHRQLHLRSAGGRSRHHAGDARPRDRAEERVRQLLFGDGLSRLAAVSRRRSPTAGRCPKPGAATRSMPWTPCRCRPGTCRQARC